MTTTTTSTVLGYPRIGPARELKRAVEAYWAGRASAAELAETAAGLRRSTWLALRDAGVGELPSNHFSLYDHVLDTLVMVGAIPPRFAGLGGLDAYFAMARGGDAGPALEMTKWFDTNYHYLVPELGPDTSFSLDAGKPLGELAEAAALGLRTRPVLLGPVTFLLLGKAAAGAGSLRQGFSAGAGFEPLSLLDGLVEVYAELLGRLAAAGAEWVQLDEPAFVTDRTAAELAALGRAYERLAALPARPKLLVATYFDHAAEALGPLAAAGVDGLAVDLTRNPERTVAALEAIGGLPGRPARIVAGVVDGRNVWATDLAAALERLEALRPLAGELTVSTSCSLLHVPVDLDAEAGLDPELRPWLAFASQKVGEVVTLARALGEGRAAVAGALEVSAGVAKSRRASAMAVRPDVRARVAALTEADERRATPGPRRAKLQADRLRLPLLPTTTIGSFPQTSELRAARADLAAGRIDQGAYEATMQAEIERVIRLQEAIGLDVLVHGEPERNDMVQYFAEQLDGYAVTTGGWVQSYGTRCVRPPILYGDVARPAPMTVRWSAYAQSLTEHPVKAMLTGPVTMLKWSFVRDDQPEADTATQVALALRDEVADLEAAGLGVIQVDEPALREALPLRRAGWEGYLRWAVAAFRLATAGVADDTQVHTHMCYSEFGEILPWIAALDADVASVEAARSGMELAGDLERVGYTAGIGPGVYDIHSPRVPAAADMAALLRRALDALDPAQLWVNPDCGLKTRSYGEVEPALAHLVEAAAQVRAALAG